MPSHVDISDNKATWGKTNICWNPLFFSPVFLTSINPLWCVNCSIFEFLGFGSYLLCPDYYPKNPTSVITTWRSCEFGEEWNVLDNKVLEYLIFSLWPSIYPLRQILGMHLLLINFIISVMWLTTWVTNIYGEIFRPSWEAFLATISLWVFDGRPEYFRDLQSTGDLTNWHWFSVMVVDTKWYSIDFFTVHWK